MTSSAQSNERHSPHTSPRFARRSTTPSVLAVQNDLYAAGTLPALSLALSSSYIGSATVPSMAPSAPPLLALNGGAATPAQKTTNRMSAPLIGAAVTQKTVTEQGACSTYAVLLNLQDQQPLAAINAVNDDSTAPPLPPRKSSPGVSGDCSFPLTNGVTNKIYGSAAQTPSKSVDNLSTQLDGAATSALNIDPLNANAATPKASNVSVSNNNNNNNMRSILDEDIVVGPAETIMGVIDTRPLEARLASAACIVSASASVSNSVSASVSSATSLIDCIAATPHYTHLCTATSTSTSSSNNLDMLADNKYELQQQQQQQQNNQQRRQQQKLLYENVTINQKDCNSVPYENINLEYITRLMSEGYSKENAITALGISRNNIEMACDILREFVSKNSV